MNKLRNITTILTIAILTASQLPMSAMAAVAETVNITDPNFMFSVCSGPDLSKLPATSKITVNHAVYNATTKQVENKPETFDGGHVPTWYKPCNFNALIDTVQHLINIAIVIGVVVALGSFVYIGYLYMTGTQGNIKKAKDILPKIFFGFIMMLAAWFIVYQLLSWLGASAGFRSLLGSP